MKKNLLSKVSALGYSEAEARGLILSGKVKVNGNPESRPGVSIPKDAQVRVDENRKYPSRAAYKLKGAFALWKKAGLCANGKICFDIGASHGGFSQVLLEEGARRIFAIDVAYGIFDFSLRNDPRIRLLERRNIRHLGSDWFSVEEVEEIKMYPPLFVACDVSFMALETVLHSLGEFLKALGLSMQGVFLFKPQFQNSGATEKGVLQDDAILLELKKKFETKAKELGFEIQARAPAHIRGRKGNQEFVYWLEFKP